jgi:hypothetical protein
MIYDPITGLILGILYGVPAYLGACLIRAILRPLWAREDTDVHPS